MRKIQWLPLFFANSHYSGAHQVPDPDLVPMPFADTLVPAHRSEGEEMRPQTHHQPHRPVKEQGGEVLLELRQGQSKEASLIPEDRT